MERIKNLSLYSKIILFFLTAMTILFAVIYVRTTSRVGFEYKDAILVPSQKNGSTAYSGKIQGQAAQFTVSADKTVTFQYGDKTYGPYTAKEDPTAIPKDNEFASDMTGVELLDGDTILFRGGVLKQENNYWLYDENGVFDNLLGLSFTDSNGVERDENGNILDPVEPSATTILRLMSDPQLTHKGTWLAWFGGLFLCVLNVLSILFADELFHLHMAFRIRNADCAEPSELEIAGRYFGWTAMTVVALVVFVIGLQ